MLASVVLLVASVVAAHAAPHATPGSLLYPVVPAAPHAYLVKPYAAAAPVVQPYAAAAPVVQSYAAAPASYSHVSHTQYTSHPVPAVVHSPVVAAPVYHSPLVYHAPAVVPVL